MIQTSAIYTASDRARDILEDNSQLSTVLHRFKIPFGFGGSTIQAVCAALTIFAILHKIIDPAEIDLK